MDRAGCVLRFRRAPACAAATAGHAGADPGGHARRAPPQILRGSARRRHHRCRCLVRTSLRPPHEPSAGNGRSPIACVATPFRKDYYAVWDRAGVDLADAIGAPVVVMSHFLPHDSATATAQQPGHPLLLASQFGPWADHALLQSAASCRSRSVSLTLCFAPMCASVGLCARLPFCPPALCIFGRCAVSSHARVCRLERQRWCATAARPTDCACRRRGARHRPALLASLATPLGPPALVQRWIRGVLLPLVLEPAARWFAVERANRARRRHRIAEYPSPPCMRRRAHRARASRGWP